MRALFLLLAFLSLVPARAQAKAKLAGLAAAQAAYEKSCHLNFARFENEIAERRLTERPVYDKEARIAERYARFDKIAEQDNGNFIELGLAANAGRPSAAKHFLFSENAVLKELNDKVVADKDLVTALTNLRKDLEHFHLAQDPILSPHIVGKYSDFKVLQVALDTTDPAIVARLNQRIENISARYGSYLESIAEERGWAQKGVGLSQDTRAWFHSGSGVSPDQAALAARDSRTVAYGEGGPRVRSFAQARAGLERAGLLTDRYRAWAAKRFAAADGMLVDAGNGEKVLSAEAIEAMKKATPLGPGPEGYREAVRAVLAKRFGATLSPKEADALIRYLSLADRFSPPLLLPKRVVIDMNQAATAVLSADFKGQNARNLEETLKALARTKGGALASRVAEVRRGEGAATARLEELKERFGRALELTTPGLRAEFSGDDGMGFLKTAYTEADQLRFVRNYLKEGGKLGDLRLTYEKLNYFDTGAVIPGEARARLVGEAEAVEKKLREKLLGALDRRELNGTKIFVRLEGAASGAARVNLLLVTAAGNKPGVAEEARRLTEGMGFAVGRVEMRAP